MKDSTDYTTRLELSGTTPAIQLASMGPARPMLLEHRALFTRLFGTPDMQVHYVTTKKTFDATRVIEKVEADGWSILASQLYCIVEEDKHKPTERVYVKENMLLSFGISYRKKESNQKSNNGPYMIDELEGISGDLVQADQLTFYTLFESNPKYDVSPILSITNALKDMIVPDSDSPSIGIISQDNGDFYVKRFSLEGKTPEFNFPDLHYGEGFEEFHKNLLDRLDKNTKGLVLLHGEPGTGKTQYIRILLKELAALNKSIIYAPPSISANLTEPAMIEFISSWIMDEERDCILLIEDAEPLLESRDNTGRSTGISNLLNMTDGLLNDILGLTVIATFNTQISKIDSALLRPKRLLARKEFKKLPKEMFVALAEALEMELPEIPYPASLAEFYSSNIESTVLTHGIQVKETKLGFGR
jgi:hypothetical protein